MRAETMTWLIWSVFALVLGGAAAINVYLWVLLRRGQRVVLAGPYFDEQEARVALRLVRKAGYRQARINR